MILVVSLIFIGVLALELPYLVRNKLWREMAAFIFLLLIGIVYSFGLVLDRQVPSLLDLMEMVFIPVTEFMEHILS